MAYYGSTLTDKQGVSGKAGRGVGTLAAHRGEGLWGFGGPVCQGGGAGCGGLLGQSMLLGASIYPRPGILLR